MKPPTIALLILLFPFIISAQEKPEKSIFSNSKTLTFYLLDVESGLSHNFVNSIEQDSLGFIWVGTLEGLNRYDGHQFSAYRKNNKSPHSGPSDNYIQHIGLNETGELMLSTGNGLSIYDPKTDQFQKPQQPTGVKDIGVSYSISGPKKETILGIYGIGVQIRDKEGKVETFRHHPDDQKTLSSDEISCLAFQGDSILWIGTFDKGLNKIDYNSKTVQRISTNHAISNRINSLYTDEKGNLWIGTNKGIRIITSRSDTLQINATGSQKTGISDNGVLCFEKGPFGNIWAGTRNGGLNIIAPEPVLQKEPDKKIKWFLPQNDGSSVFNRTVSSLKRSRDGNMWIGTSTGVNFVNPHGEPVKLIQRNLSNPQTISHDRIGALAESKNENIWIGTDGGGLDYFSPEAGVTKHFSHQENDPKSLSNNFIISLLEDSRQRVWAGTYQGGLNLLNPQTGQFKHYLQGSQEDGNDVRVIFEDRKKRIWVGTNRGGLYRYHEPSDAFDYVRQLGKIDIRDIEEDQLGNLWLATFGSGILRYNYLTGELESFNESTIPNFPGGIIFNLTILENGDILAGSRYQGLLKLEPKSKTVTVFTQKDGLSNNTINSIIKGADGKIWLGTYFGISYYDPSTQKVGNLNAYNNVQQSEFNIGAALSSKSGKIYLGGNKGLNVFNPESLQRKSNEYPLVFTDLRLMNKEVSFNDSKESPTISRSIPYLKELKLNYDQSLFSVDFVALKYPQSREITYAYLLENYHDQWVETEHTGTAHLSNIPPGNYTLKVRAQSSTGEYSKNEMAVIIAPPFWKTWPAYLIYLFLIAGLAIGGLKYYADRLKLKSSLLFEKKQRQLEHELNEERARFFTGFSHELKTPLTLIMAPIEDLLKEIQNKKQLKGLHLVQKNAIYLLEMINKLLEFRKTELDLRQLQIENHPISKHLKQWVADYQPLARHRKISLTENFPQKDFIAAVDIEKLHIIVNNLLSNALKYCRPNDKVEVTLTEKDEYFEIKVKDSGPGIENKDLDRIFLWYYQSGNNANQKGTGIGLALTKRLVEDHQGSIHLSSDPGQGCNFTLKFPKKEVELPPVENPASSNSHNSLWAPNNHEELNLPLPQSNFDLKSEKSLLLLIDDNPQILAYLDNLLENQFDLIHAENGQIGLEKAMKYVPDLIISDIMMPQKNGIDLCGILKNKEATTHIPVILLSAKDSVESVTSGYGKGADDYITKPFNGSILISRVNNLLEAKIRLRTYYLGKAELDNKLPEAQKTEINREKAFLKKLEELIIQQISEQNSDVDTIAQMMGMSRTSLFRKLKAITGQNINQFIRSVKLNKAAYLIKEEKLGVAQAAYEVGFSSPKYFRKLFKEQFGKVPSEIGETET